MVARWIVVACAAGCAGGGEVASVPLVGLGGGVFYTAKVTVGGQPFALQIDTGSTTTAVAGSDCASCTGVSPTYDASRATDENNSATTTYADNSTWTGEIFGDTVQLAGGPQAVSLELVSITDQNGFFTDNSNQGILGLGPVDLEDPGTTSFLGQSMQAGVDPVMAFQLCKSTGRLWLGGFDESFMTTPPKYAPMLAMDMSDPFFSITIGDMGVGGTSLGFHAADFGPALADTGTGEMVLPQAISDALAAHVEASSGFQALFGTQTFAGGAGCVSPVTATSDAQVDAMLPPFELVLPSEDGGTFTLTSSPLQSYLLPVSGGYCLAVESVSGFDATILGDTILRAFITVIDQPNQRIGFAPQVGCN